MRRASVVAGVAAAVVVLLALLPAHAAALHFYLDYGATRCFTEELPKNTLVLANYRTLMEENERFVENPEVGIIVSVTEVVSRNSLLKLKKDHAGRFTFTSANSGDHDICIRTNQTAWSYSKQRAKIYLDLVVGEGANDINEQREKLSGLALSVRDLNNRIVDIRREQQYQKEQEEVFRDMSEAVNARVVWFILLQVGVILVVAAWQMRHLTQFFAAKKVA